MKKTVVTSLAAIVLAAGVLLLAQEAPQMPQPVKEHEWLQQLVGTWDAEAEMHGEPGQPAMQSKGIETVRSVGGFWVQTEMKSTLPWDSSAPFTGIMTLGYDPGARKYRGTWIDSMTSHLWIYEGALDATGKVLTLETRGPCPHRPGELANFRETIEIKDAHIRTFTTSIQNEDGTWTKMMTATSRRRG